jgi:hypothetical protein
VKRSAVSTMQTSQAARGTVSLTRGRVFLSYLVGSPPSGVGVSSLSDNLAEDTLGGCQQLALSVSGAQGAHSKVSFALFWMSTCEAILKARVVIQTDCQKVSNDNDTDI